jgi:hypothetical protein
LIPIKWLEKYWKKHKNESLEAIKKVIPEQAQGCRQSLA